MDLLHRHPWRHWTASTTKPCIWPQGHRASPVGEPLCRDRWAFCTLPAQQNQPADVHTVTCNAWHFCSHCLDYNQHRSSLRKSHVPYFFCLRPESSCIVLTRKVQKSCPRASISLYSTLWNCLLCAKISSRTPLGKQGCLPQLLLQSSWLTWPPTTQQLYTDGTKSATGVIFAAVFLGKVVFGKLPSASSMFTAELDAILPTVTYMLKLSQREFVVRSNSQNALKSICNNLSFHLLVREIHRWLQILSHRGKTVSFCWGPGHVGVHVNERADRSWGSCCSQHLWFYRPYFSTLQRLLCSFLKDLMTTMALSVEGHLSQCWALLAVQIDCRREYLPGCASRTLTPDVRWTSSLVW